MYLTENGVLLQRELSRLGLIGLASRVVVDTVPLSPYIGDVERYNAINKALKMDYISGIRCPNKFRLKENLKLERFKKNRQNEGRSPLLN